MERTMYQHRTTVAVAHTTSCTISVVSNKEATEQSGATVVVTDRATSKGSIFKENALE
jgi:hypothetical protein